MISVGFTGTRDFEQISVDRQLKLIELLADYRDVANVQGAEFHHGDAIGADAFAHYVAVDLGYTVHVWPPTYNRYRAWVGEWDYRYEPNDYLVRNRSIVDHADLMIAVPKDSSIEELRSGTWAAIRYAHKTDTPVEMI